MAGEDAQADRITRLEEALLFAERRVDQLHEEVLGLADGLERVAARLAAVERLALAPEPGAEPPSGDEQRGDADPPA